MNNIPEDRDEVEFLVYNVFEEITKSQKVPNEYEKICIEYIMGKSYKEISRLFQIEIAQVVEIIHEIRKLLGLKPIPILTANSSNQIWKKIEDIYENTSSPKVSEKIVIDESIPTEKVLEVHVQETRVEQPDAIIDECFSGKIKMWKPTSEKFKECKLALVGYLNKHDLEEATNILIDMLDEDLLASLNFLRTKLLTSEYTNAQLIKIMFESVLKLKLGNHEIPKKLYELINSDFNEAQKYIRALKKKNPSGLEEILETMVEPLIQLIKRR